MIRNVLIKHFHKKKQTFFQQNRVEKCLKRSSVDLNLFLQTVDHGSFIVYFFPICSYIVQV